MMDGLDKNDNHQLLTNLYKRLQEVGNRWQIKDAEVNNPFATAYLVPLSRQLGVDGPTGAYSDGIGLGDLMAVKIWQQWYEDGNHNDANAKHPKHAHPTWADGIERVEKYLLNKVEQGAEVNIDRPAPWMIVTTPNQDGLLNGLRLQSNEAHLNEEGLLPHKTDWSQTMFLTLKFKEQSLFTWVNEKHPEWLDEKGEMAPLSHVSTERELKPSDQMERDYILSELAHLRDMERHGQFFLNEHQKGEPFYAKRGMNEASPTWANPSRKMWLTETEGMNACRRRRQAETVDLSYNDSLVGARSLLNTASKAQVLIMAAQEKGQSMEEGLYYDPSSRQQRQALMFQTDWLSKERLLLLESWIAQYQSHGLEGDKAAYRDLLIEQGADEASAFKKAQEVFDSRVTPAIARTLGLLDTLSSSLDNPPSDAVNQYLEAPATGSQAPERNSDGVEVIGVSVDSSRLHVQLQTLLRRNASRNRVWHTDRGSDQEIMKYCDDLVRRNGYIGEDTIYLDPNKKVFVPVSHPASQVIKKQEQSLQAAERRVQALEAETVRLTKDSAFNRSEAMKQYKSRMRLHEGAVLDQMRDLMQLVHAIGFVIPPIKEKNPRYERLGLVNESVEGVAEYLELDVFPEAKDAQRRLYPDGRPVTYMEARKLISDLAETHIAETMNYGARVAVKNHHSLMQMRQQKGLTTFGWNSDNGEKPLPAPASSRPKFV